MHFSFLIRSCTLAAHSHIQLSDTWSGLKCVGILLEIVDEIGNVTTKIFISCFYWKGGSSDHLRPIPTEQQLADAGKRLSLGGTCCLYLGQVPTNPFFLNSLIYSSVPPAQPVKASEFVAPWPGSSWGSVVEWTH